MHNDSKIQELKRSPIKKNLECLEANSAKKFEIGNSPDHVVKHIDRSRRVDRPLGLSLELKKPTAMQNFD